MNMFAAIAYIAEISLALSGSVLELSLFILTIAIADACSMRIFPAKSPSSMDFCISFS